MVFVSPKINILKIKRKLLYQHTCNNCWDYHFINWEKLDAIEPLFCEDCPVDYMKAKRDELCDFYSWYQILSSRIVVPVTMEEKRKQTKKLKKQLYEIYTNVCQYCYNSYPYDDLQVDHIIPWSWWWSNELSNLTLACKKCNWLLSNKLFNSFDEKQEYILNFL